MVRACRYATRRKAGVSARVPIRRAIMNGGIERDSCKAVWRQGGGGGRTTIYDAGVGRCDRDWSDVMTSGADRAGPASQISITPHCEKKKKWRRERERGRQ